jgi:hypothetical protein
MSQQASSFKIISTYTSSMHVDVQAQGVVAVGFYIFATTTLTVMLRSLLFSIVEDRIDTAPLVLPLTHKTETHQ